MDHPDYFAHSPDANGPGVPPFTWAAIRPALGDRRTSAGVPVESACLPEPLEHSRKTPMGRRTVLLIVAALIAALGAGMVFLYVRGADSRAEAGQSPVQVLKAVAQIDPGETMAAAQAAGKIQIGTVPRAQVLAGAVNSASGLEDKVALVDDLPQGADHHGQVRVVRRAECPDHSRRRHRHLPHLSDTGRVAGFVNPGANVAIFATGTQQSGSAVRHRRHPAPAAEGAGDRRRSHHGRLVHDDRPRRARRPPSSSPRRCSRWLSARPMPSASSSPRHTESSPSRCSTTSPTVKAGPGVSSSNLYR